MLQVERAHAHEAEQLARSFVARCAKNFNLIANQSRLAEVWIQS